MSEAIFLSAGVPDARRGPEFAETADPVAIASAVAALLYVTLGRRLLVFGGQPAITPMVWTVAEQMGVDYGAWVRLYQSMEFEDDFPEETAKFANVVFTPKRETRAESLRAMRLAMFHEERIATAVFAGGMGGIVDEYQLLREIQPEARIVPMYSSGGAVLKLAELGAPSAEALWSDFNYVRLLHDQLGISAREQRYAHPSDQPPEESARLRPLPDAR